MVWIFIHFERISFVRASGWCNAEPGELLKLSDEFVNWSFCQLDISRVQVKSNWTVGKRLPASDSKTFWKSRLILSKSLLFFFYGRFGNWFLWKELVWRSFWMMSCCTQGTAQTFRWPCKPIILSIGHFQSPTELQLNSW